MRIERLDRSRHRRSVVALVVAGLLVAAVPIAAAQTGSAPVASGEFSGSVGLDGGFSIAPTEGGEVVVLVNGTGPLELTLTDGTMSGTWLLPISQTISGEFGGAVTITGNGSGTSSGEMSGPPGNYAMTGTYDFTNTATVTVSGLPAQSATTSDSGPVDVPITDVLVLCDQITGRWDHQAKQEIQGAGFNEFIRGYFSAKTGVDATEQAAEVASLVADVNAWASGAPGLEEGGRSLYIGLGLALLSRAQTIQAQLRAPTPCPPDPTFMTDLSLAAQDALNTFVDRFPGFTTPAVVGLAIGSGAIGAGSPAPADGAALQAKMEAAINETFDGIKDDLVANENQAIDMARSGQMLGMDRMGSTELSPGDILLVLGAE